MQLNADLKKSKTMKKVIALVIIAASLFSCTPEPSVPVQNCGADKNVAYTSFVFCNELKENPKYLKGLRVDAQDKFESLFKPCLTLVALPPIDFTKNTLIGVLAGEKPTGGYNIKVESIVENDCEMVLFYSKTSPVAGQNQTQATTYPQDFVLIPKTTKEIFLRKVAKTTNFVVLGSGSGFCPVNCFNYFKINPYSVVSYLNAGSDFDANNYKYKSLVTEVDYNAIIKAIPAEITALKGKTKTFGSPDSRDQGVVYFEWREENAVTKIKLDPDNTPDQTAAVIAFKKILTDKIAVLKTAN
jgi:PrcB C-terminal